MPKNATSQMKKEIKYIEKTSRRLAKFIFTSMIRYQQKLEYKQLRLGRLMEIGTDLFAMSCTLSFWLSQKDKEFDQVAHHFCELAKLRIEHNFKAIHENADTSGNALAKSIIEDKLTWLEEGIINMEY